ncbi:MAG: phytanoyl-CoA dioxygenase family protein [Sphingomonas sp.]|nr:phytanoyl-CoA dioxygenase family protein [Sphingomonas sp.]
MADRLILDGLGLGLEQAMRYLRLEAPELAEFEAWIVATAGEPDPETVARYHAWLDGLPPPPTTAARIAAIDALPPVLDTADLAHWDAHGWVILRQAITPDEARASAELLWRVTGARLDEPASWYGLDAQGIMIQCFQAPELEAPRRSDRVHKAFAQLWGTADLWHRIDRMSFNPPERGGYMFPGPHLHWDESIAPPIPFATQGILYFTDTAAHQGALRLVPGFHHRLAEGWLGALDDADPREVDLSAEAIPIPASAGDLIIWRQELPHGASPNRAALPRMAQYVTMVSADLVPNPVWR